MRSVESFPVAASTRLRSEKDVRVWPRAALGWLRKIGMLKA